MVTLIWPFLVNYIRDVTKQKYCLFGKFRRATTKFAKTTSTMRAEQHKLYEEEKWYRDVYE